MEPILPGSAGDLLGGAGGACCHVRSQGFSCGGKVTGYPNPQAGWGTRERTKVCQALCALPHVRNWVPVPGSCVPDTVLHTQGCPHPRHPSGHSPGAARWLASCGRAAAPRSRPVARCGRLLPSVGPRWQRSAALTHPQGPGWLGPCPAKSP